MTQQQPSNPTAPAATDAARREAWQWRGLSDRTLHQGHIRVLDEPDMLAAYERGWQGIRPDPDADALAAAERAGYERGQREALRVAQEYLLRNEGQYMDWTARVMVRAALEAILRECGAEDAGGE